LKLKKPNSSIVFSQSNDPWFNLALEEYLFSTIPENTVLMYLWQNHDTIVIGSNQNPWKECDLNKVEADGVKLARRLSGGGAVYHDSGNLNFTFISDNDLYDQKRQLGVILEAVQAFGFSPAFSGRNDVLLEGKKFSGNAYFYGEEASFHHGTLLVSADLSRLSSYLTPSNHKIISKGIDSVSARVRNLSTGEHPLAIEEMKQSLIASFQKEYGECLTVDRYSPQGQTNPQLARLYEKYASWKWIFGESPSFEVHFERSYPWGEILLGLNLVDGCIDTLQVLTDTLVLSFVSKLKKALPKTTYTYPAIEQALLSLGETEEERCMFEDILLLFKQQM
jgi:lipoate-protein ligase A